MQRAYYLDRDIDKALRRMALEEGKNLTESVNDALRAGLTKYLYKSKKERKSEGRQSQIKSGPYK